MEIETSIGIDAGGWYVEWYREGEDGNGEVCRWYGSREACATRALRPPCRSWWLPIVEDDAPDAFDLACERRWD